MAPPSCDRLEVLEVIRDGDPAPDWRDAAISNLDKLAQCTPTPACGTAPGPDFYREFTSGCWYHATGVHPAEYATWDQGCDAEGYVSGTGTLTFHYPVKVADHFFDRRQGPFAKGRPGSGVVTNTTLAGTVYADTFRDGVRHGPSEQRDPVRGLHISGSYRDGERHGEWNRSDTNGYRHNVRYDQGRLISGRIRYAGGITYEGALDQSISPQGFGTLTIYRDNGTALVTTQGGWRNGKENGRILSTSYNNDSSVRRSSCWSYADGTSLGQITLAPGERCLR